MTDNRIQELREALRHRFGRPYARPSLAQRVGVSERALLNYEKGVNVPSATVAIAIARELGVSVEQLWAVGRDGGRAESGRSNPAHGSMRGR
jgi:DNA-binding XRE family transcriptional regulator